MALLVSPEDCRPCAAGPPSTRTSGVAGVQRSPSQVTATVARPPPGRPKLMRQGAGLPSRQPPDGVPGRATPRGPLVQWPRTRSAAAISSGSPSRAEAEIRHLPLDQAGVQAAGADVGVVDQQPQVFDVGVDPQHGVPGQRRVQRVRAPLAVLAPGDDLGEHGVVVAGDFQPRQQGRSRSGRAGPRQSACRIQVRQGGEDRAPFVQQHHFAGGRQEVPLRDLRVDARLHRVAGKHDVVLRHGEHLTGGDPHLPFDEVDAGDHLGDGVLHLQAGVHLHEEELVRGVVRDQELHGAGAAVVDAAGRVAGGLADPGAGGAAVGQGFQQRRRRFLDDLLVPALQRALALAQVDDVAVVVGQDLDLDVPRRVDQPFQEEGVVAEGARRDPPGGGQRGRQVLRAAPRCACPCRRRRRRA